MSYRKAKQKKFIGIFVVAVALVIAACFAMPFFGESEGYRTITVFDVSGTVGVVKDGIEYEAYPGMLLQEGHVIVTSENSYARLVLDDDKYVKVESGSRLEFETLGLLGSGKTRLKLDRGALTTEIVNPLGEDEEYVVNTPNAVLAVRGTFFRVDLKVTEKGEIDTNVYTYGGKVASNRVMPTGEVIEEEVIVDAGYMTAIRMDAVDTIYIVGTTESPTGEPVEETRKNTVPIEPVEIPDEDLVDMYFASENGHEMFLSTDEIKENIEEREISIEEQAPVYDKANEVKTQLQEEANTESTTSTALIPDDRGDWEESTEIVVEEPDDSEIEEVIDSTIENELEETVVENEEVVEEEVQESQTETVVVSPVVDTTTSEEPHVHSYTSEITTQATCMIEGVKTYSCTCGESYTEAIAATGHSEVNGGTADKHTECVTCGEVVNDNHSYTNTETKAVSCTDVGEMTHTCTCGYVYTTEIAATGHSEVNGGTETSHTECANCGEVISDSHSYTDSVTKAASCTEVGETTHTCTCGYAYTTEIAATGHTEDTPVDTVVATCTTEGTRTTSCKDCGELLKEEIIPLADHKETTRTRAAGCETEGKETVSCQVCNAILSETTLNATGHTRTDTAVDVTTCSNAGCGETLVVANSTAVFPDATFRNIVQGYDFNSDGLLSDTERFSVGSFDISSSGVTDVTGLTYFSFISQLYCRDNISLTSLDTTGMSMLTLVDIQNSGIKNLEITSDKNNGNLQALYAQNCSALESLKLNGTNIEMLYLDNCTELTTLDVTNCVDLTGVDVLTCTKLTTFIKTGSGLE